MLSIKTKTVFCVLLIFAVSQGVVWAQDRPSIAQTDAQVQGIYETLYAGNCRSLMEGETPRQPTIFELEFNYGDENFPPRPYRLYEYLCFEGPYNLGYVYFGADDYHEISSINFAIPTYDVTHEGDDSHNAVLDIEVSGWTATNQLTNANFDPKTLTIHNFNKWRGPADAFSSGSWTFIGGEFVLQFFEVDASFDGERHPLRIYGEGPATFYENGEGD